jgi:hypothetical protein
MSSAAALNAARPRSRLSAFRSFRSIRGRAPRHRHANPRGVSEEPWQSRQPHPIREDRAAAGRASGTF